jgi:glycosyltransferase involved in cell wall biosynthesis
MSFPKIAILIGSKKIGGSELQAALLAKRLILHGFKVVVFFMDRPFRFSQKNSVEFKGINCIHLWNISVIKKSYILKYFRLLLKIYRINILHYFNIDVMDPLFAANATTSKNSPVLISGIRNSHFIDDPHYRKNIKLAFEQSIAVVCNSKQLKSKLLTYKIAAPTRTYCIYNGVNLPEIKRIKTPFSVRCDILFVGSLTAIKDPINLINSSLMLLRKGYKFRVVIAGDGPLRNELEHYCKDSGYRAQFFFLGYVPQNKIPFDTARVLVSTSLQEGNSNAIVEALAHGIPVVSTSVGGAVELLSKFNRGSLVPRQSPEITAAAIKHWINCTEKDWNDASRTAQNIVAEKFNTDRMVQEHIDLYLKTTETQRN